MTLTRIPVCEADCYRAGAAPDRRKMTREPSENRKRMPWCSLTLPSTGSLYENSSALSITKFLTCSTAVSWLQTRAHIQLLCMQDQHMSAPILLAATSSRRGLI